MRARFIVFSGGPAGELRECQILVILERDAEGHLVFGLHDGERGALAYLDPADENALFDALASAVVDCLPPSPARAAPNVVDFDAARQRKLIRGRPL